MEEYTFEPEEKEILQKLSTIEASVKQQNLQEKNQREIIAIKYYSEFSIETEKGEIILTDVFITAEKDEQGKMSYHFRWIEENENGEHIVEEKLSIDENGKCHAVEGLREYLGDQEIDIEELMAQNDIVKGRLKGVSEKTNPEQLKTNMEKQNKKEDDIKEIEQDLNSGEEDLELTNIRKIKDPYVVDRMPEVFGDSDEHAHAYSKKLGKFVMLEKNYNETNENGEQDNKGKWQINDKVEPAQTAWKSVISIGENGEKIERRVPHALMETNRDDKEIAISYGQYGEINIETVDVLPCDERIARGVREQGETLSKQEDSELRREFETQGKEYPHELAHDVMEIENAQSNSGIVKDYDITETDYIPNTKITWGELMEETGENLPKLIERYNNDMEKSNGRKTSEQVVQEINDDYQMVSHEHTHQH